MRCVNCGWDNSPNATVCEKCGHPMQAYGQSSPAMGAPAGYMNQGGPAPRATVLNAAQPAPKPTVLNAAQPAPKPTVLNAGQPAPKPTTIFNGAPQGAPAASNPSHDVSQCPSCGYPVLGDFQSCPSCGAPIKRQAQPAPAPAAPKPVARPAAVEFDLPSTVTCQKCGEEVPASSSFCPKCGEKIHLQTVRAIRHRPEPKKPQCSLTLIPEEDDTTEAFTKNYEGESVILNRDNTEPTNRTITSKEQAALIFEEGKWYLENRSELGSTYLEANRKLEILPGDVVVLGDRRFKFEPK